MTTPETQKTYKPEHVNTKEIEFEGERYSPDITHYLRDKIRERYGKILKKFERKQKLGLKDRIEQSRDLFINEFLFDVAIYIAECSENGENVCCEDIAKEFNVDDIKFVHNKLPFLRKIFELIGLNLETTFIDPLENAVPKKAKVKSMKIPVHKLTAKK